MIDIRKLKELVKLMVENDLSELDLKDQEETVAIKRGATGTVVNHQPVIYQGSGGMPAMQSMPRPTFHGSTGGDEDGGAAPAAPAGAGSSASDAGLVAIESPMVGTFYSAPNPDTPAFVSVGASISNDSVVCLIEAMKVFNEIKAEVTGTIERVLVNNGDAVEFGQKLFLVRPA
jgi:acetyl-CoA carboxylase biotin carboxyl carrier protein